MDISQYFFRELFQLPWVEDHGNVDEALLHLICLCIFLDGEVSEEEAERAYYLIEQLYTFEKHDPEQIRDVLTQTVVHVRHMGLETTLKYIKERLTEAQDKLRAVQVVAYLSQTDGIIAPIERALLQSIINELELDHQAVQTALDDLQRELDTHVERVGTNPFLASSGMPQFDKLQVEQVEPAVGVLLETCERQLQALKKRLKALDAPTFSDVIEPIDHLNHRLGYTWGLIGHLLSVKNSPELRDAYQKVQPKLVSFSIKLGQDPDIYHALEAVLANKDQLTDAQLRIVDSMVRDAKHSGVGLEGVEKAQFNALQMEMAELRTLFSNNLLDGTKAFELILTTEEEIDGLPESFKQLAAQSAREAGHEDATAENGPWRVTLDGPSLMPVLSFSTRRDLREQVYRAYLTRAAHTDGPDNTPVLKRTLELRKEMAQLLGYDNYAELSLSAKMAPDVGAVEKLLEELRVVSYDAAQKDHETLSAFAKEKNAPEADDLKQWDIGFWAERLREEAYGYSAEELKPYFPLPHVLNGLFSLIERLFDVTIKASDEPVAVWHDDVKFFKVYNQQDETIAAFFLDAYSRPADKRGGAWHNTCQNRSVLLAPKGEDVRIPVSYLICNQTPPVDGKPSLMSFREVLTLFHEFGHGLQHMLTQVDYTMIAGIEGIEWDAVELPSQFMENWCYQTNILKQLTKHVDTGEPLPDELIEKLQAAKNFRAGSGMLRQLYFGLMDMKLHHSYDPKDEDVSPFDVQREVAKKTSLLPLLEEDRFLCTFSHIFAGGYAAGYYSYKWAEVLSADAFAAFEEAGLEDEDAVTETGRRFRDTVLAEGGSKHPMDVFVAFRGREPSTEPLLRHYGLK